MACTQLISLHTLEWCFLFYNTAHQHRNLLCAKLLPARSLWFDFTWLLNVATEMLLGGKWLQLGWKSSVWSRPENCPFSSPLLLILPHIHINQLVISSEGNFPSICTEVCSFGYWSEYWNGCQIHYCSGWKLAFMRCLKINQKFYYRVGITPVPSIASELPVYFESSLKFMQVLIFQQWRLIIFFMIHSNLMQ